MMPKEEADSLSFEDLVAEEKPEDKSAQKSRSKKSKSKVPAKVDEVSLELASALAKIESHLSVLTDKQHASPEFKALMDGYVNKANECEAEKVRARAFEEKYEELRADHRALKEAHKSLQSELEATKEALRESEADLHKVKQEYSNYKNSTEEKIHELTEDKRSANQKVRDLIAEREKNSAEFNSMQAKTLEAKHLYKQLEADRNIERDNYERAIKEAENMVAQYKEQLDLRTRELEYKDALLNQLIREASGSASTAGQPVAAAPVPQAQAPKASPQKSSMIFNPDEPKAEENLNQDFSSLLNAAASSPAQSPVLPDKPIQEQAAKPKGGGIKWGAFRK